MDGEALVAAADAASYRAKQAGRNQVCGPEPAPAREEPGGGAGEGELRE